MGYMVAARFHDQPLDLPYLAVGGMDGLAAEYLYLPQGDGVVGDRPRGARAAIAVAPATAVEGQVVHLVRTVAWVP